MQLRIACSMLLGMIAVLSQQATHATDGMQDPERLRQIGSELRDLKDVLVQRLGETINAVEGGFSAVKGHLWIGHEDAEAAAAALLPKLQKAQESLQQTLFELVTLELAVERSVDAVVLATLMPRCVLQLCQLSDLLACAVEQLHRMRMRR